jgi:hypothetical protein
LLASTFIVLALAVFFIYRLVVGALPREEGEARLSDLSAAVDVYRICRGYRIYSRPTSTTLMWRRGTCMRG